MSERRRAPSGSDGPRGHRRPLSNVGGPVETHGEPAVCPALATAFGGELSADDARQHVHGFHSYPARLHPTIARRAIELFAPPGGLVLDPFCGSGTVIVEARLSGRPSIGSDINPIAVMLARLKVRGARDEELRRVVAAAHDVGQHARARRIAKAGATRRYPETDTHLFDPHVLLELDGLRDGIERGPAGFVREALQLVLSAILIKVSRQQGDTGELRTVPKRLAAGFATRLFVAKTEELAERISQFQHRLPANAPPARIEATDARELRGVDAESVDLVVTSPPYPGNYDYLAHHAARMRWLGLDARTFDAQEIGARRHLVAREQQDAVARFEGEMKDALRAVRNTLRAGGRALIVMADSVAANRAVRAESLVIRAAQSVGLAWVATATQRRPHFHRDSARAFDGSPRGEHAILLERRASRAAARG